MAGNIPYYKLVDNRKLSGVSGNKDLLEVMKATATIGDWSVLSLQFDITKAEYKNIFQKVMMQGGTIQMEIISRWFQLGNASWSALVKCLCEVGEVDVAQEIAKAHPLVASGNGTNGNAEALATDTPVHSSDIWKKSPILYDANRVLRDMTARWDALGGCLEVSKDIREGLAYHNMPDSSKLETVLQVWMESYCSPVTWEHLFNVLKDDMKRMDEAAKIEQYLQKDDIKKKYEDKPIWKKI